MGRERLPIINPAPIVLSMSHPDLRPYIWMLCGSFSFTLMGVLAHMLLHVNKACDWQTVAVFRAGLVALFAALVARLAGAKLVFWPWRLWVRSIAGSGSMVCTFYAFDCLPLPDVITLANTFPLWVTILSWPLYRHAPGVKMGIAILIGFAGVAAFVEQPQFQTGNLGVVAALAAAALTAVAMLGLHSISDIDPRAVVVHFSSVATVVCLIAFFIWPREHDIANVIDPSILLKLVGMGVAALVGQLCLTLAFATGAPTKVSVVGLTQTVFALIFWVCLFDQKVDNWTLLGTVLIIAPTAWLLTRSRKPESGIGGSTPNSRRPSPDQARLPK